MQVETVGFNQWDEEWEVGRFDTTTGVNVSRNDQIRSKNYIPIIPGESYYIHTPVVSITPTYNYPWVLFFDANKNAIAAPGISGRVFGNSVQIPRDTVFSVPSNACYMRFYMQLVYGITYNHDICINISDTSKNGTYEPYRKSTIQLNLSSFQVLDSQGNVTTIEGGLKSAGSVYDEIVGNKYIKRVGSVDLGDLTWAATSSSGGADGYSASVPTMKVNTAQNLICSKFVTKFANSKGSIYAVSTLVVVPKVNDTYTDSATFKTAMNGVMLYYELATPIEYELVEPLVPTTKAGTTEARISPNADGLSAPFCADMTYSVADYIEYADRAGALVKGASVDLTDIVANGELSGDAFKVIAEHIAKLTARVEVLEAGVGTVDTLSSTSVDSANGYYINGDKTVIIGSGAPTMVPAFAGQFYINTSGPALYYAVNNSATTD